MNKNDNTLNGKTILYYVLEFTNIMQLDLKRMNLTHKENTV